MSKLTFKIEGMCCSEEMATIKSVINPLLNGREDLLNFDLISEKITIEQQEGLPTESDVIRAVETTGMKAIPWKMHVERKQPPETYWQRHGQATMAAASTISLGAGFAIHAIQNGFSDAFFADEKENNTYPPEVIAFYALSMLTGSWFILPKAVRAVLRMRPDMNLLMTIAIGGAGAINQWFEAATASSLFSASLLLESWNVNRARQSIRALMGETPLTARVIEKQITRTIVNEQYTRHIIPRNGDCGYTALGITRNIALSQLIESLDSVKEILTPAVQECLLTDNFYNYLIENEAIAEDIAHEQVIENIESYAHDINIVTHYLYYDIGDKQIDAGWSHPYVLQALAHIQQKEIHMWRLNESGALVPHQGNEYDYTVYMPTNAVEKIDVLFVDGNHFDRLEFHEKGSFLQSDSASSSDLEVTNNTIIEKMVDEIEVGSIIAVRPGEKIPMDSILISESTDVNQAPITGESMPVHKESGDELFAGTINGDAAILCKVTKAASDSTIARIISMVEAAQSRRSNSEQFVETFAAYYTPLMMVVSLLVLVVLPLVFGQSWTAAFYQALEILVISCPCALVVSTPVSIVAGLNAAASSGVLVKGGIYLEAPAHIRAIAMDKTGTLTSGEPTVQEIIVLDDRSIEDLLKLALSLEEHSDHPLARAIRRKAASNNIFMDKEAEQFRIFKGKGAEGYVDGILFWIGSYRFMREKVGDHLPMRLQEKIESLESSGHSVVSIGYDQNLCGLIGIADTIRPESSKAVHELKQIGIEKVIMLTGDNEGSAKVIARLAGIDEYRAGLLPEDKVAQVESLVSEYQQVAMVGDGVNDAPAMAVSNLSIAMGAAGSDAAIETADIALMSDDLEKLPWLINHSRRTLFIIKENVVISLSVKGVMMGLVFANKATLGMAIAADLGTSFIVVFNALRLLNDRWCSSRKIEEKGATPTVLARSTRTTDKDEFELALIDEKSTFFEKQPATLLSKKACCKNDACSKPKSQPPVLIGESAFFEERAVEIPSKKSCCKEDSCSKPTSQPTVLTGKSTFFEEQAAAKQTSKKACCKGDSCSKPASPALALAGKNTFFEGQSVEPLFKKACCKGNAYSSTAGSVNIQESQTQSMGTIYPKCDNSIQFERS